MKRQSEESSSPRPLATVHLRNLSRSCRTSLIAYLVHGFEALGSMLSYSPPLPPTNSNAYVQVIALQAMWFRKRTVKTNLQLNFRIRVIKIYTELEVCKKLHAFLTSALYESVVNLTSRLPYLRLSLDRRLGGLHSSLDG